MKQNKKTYTKQEKQKYRKLSLMVTYALKKGKKIYEHNKKAEEELFAAF